jgi:hypothetical protein
MIFGLGAIIDKTKRLGVMDNDEFGIEREAMKVALLVFAEDFKVAGLRVVRRAMKGVVEGLGDRVEILAADNDVPAEGQAQILGQRNDAIENFGNAAAEGSGIHHFDAAPKQRTSQDA